MTGPAREPFGTRLAAAMAARSGATPVHRWIDRAAWCTSIPSPSTGRAPASVAARSNGVSRGR